MNNENRFETIGGALSSRGNGVMYIQKLDKKTGNVTCNCPGFIYNRKCWHTKTWAQAIGAKVQMSLKEKKAFDAAQAKLIKVQDLEIEMNEETVLIQKRPQLTEVIVDEEGD